MPNSSSTWKVTAGVIAVLNCVRLGCVVYIDVAEAGSAATIVSVCVAPMKPLAVALMSAGPASVAR